MEQYTVLVVEDDTSMARVLEVQLKTGGYRVLLAVNGEEGLKIAKETPPALILSDIMMPLMDGYELCRNVKRDPKLWQIPVILLSAKADKASVIHGFAVGAAKYLIKPMRKEELFKAIDLRLKFAAKARQMLERKARDIEGDLGRISIFKTLDMFSIGGWSGYIELVNEVGKRGCIYIEHGAIDKCSLEGQFSPYSIFLLLSWEEGTFKAHRY
ncbi:MAG TPA: response regulator [Candidatus Edwardsbacteria bacterium]|nr:response regulator [Candidatus Edwardsbacteria bacterium]